MSFGGQLARAACNAGLFVVAARVLGVDGFGGFASCVALVALAMPFANLGAISLMIRRNAHHPDDVAADYGSAVVVTVLGGMVVAGLLTVANELFAPIGMPSSVVFLIAIGDLIGYSSSLLSGAVLQSRDCILGTAFFPRSSRWADWPASRSRGTSPAGRRSASGPSRTRRGRWRSRC